jgi:hypothetical protein
MEDSTVNISQLNTLWIKIYDSLKKLKESLKNLSNNKILSNAEIHDFINESELIQTSKSSEEKETSKKSTSSTTQTTTQTTTQKKSSSKNIDIIKIILIVKCVCIFSGIAIKLFLIYININQDDKIFKVNKKP